MPANSVISAAFVITLAGLASRALGLLRDRFLASTFGAGDVLDIYYAAFRIPDLIYNLLVLGALSAAFIPVFTGLISKKEQKEKDEAWKLANGILNLALIFIIGISAVMVIFAPYLMKILTPGFSQEKMETTVQFTRIMFLSPLFLGISGIFGGILTSFKRFLIYSIAPIMYNAGIIFGILVLVKFFGPVGLAWGVVFGAMLHMLIQYPAAKHLGFRYSWSFKESFQNAEVKKVFHLMVPRILGIAVNQINLLVMTVFASTLATGSLTVFNFAQNLQSVPLGIFGVSFAIAVFPTLSAFAAKKENKNFVKSFSETFRQILFFVIPLSIFILVLRAQLVRVVLGAGKFDWEDTVLTLQCLGIFSLSLFAQSTVPLLARSFYALRDTKTPFYIALATEAASIISVLLLIDRLGVVALAAAFSIASIIQMLLLLFVLRTKFENLDDKKIISSVSKIAAASFLAGVSMQGMKYVVAQFAKLDTFLEVFAQLAIPGIVGIFIFSVVCYFLKSEEFFMFKESLTRKIFREKKIISENTGEVSGV